MNSKALRSFVDKLTLLKRKNPEIYTIIKHPPALMEGLHKLDRIIGLETMKENVVEFITSVLMDKASGKFIPEENNIVICGKAGVGKSTIAGVGKSTIAAILGWIINALGVPHWEDKTEPLEEVNSIGALLRAATVKKYSKTTSDIDKIRRNNTLYQLQYQEICNLVYITSEKLKELEKIASRAKTEEDFEKVRGMTSDINRTYNISVIGKINTFDLNSGNPPLEKSVEFENKYKHTTKTDFVGAYVGSTGEKTKRLLDKCRGGVIFIDEFYVFNNAIGDGKQGNEFGLEALTEICNDITANHGSITYIIAGYKDKLISNIFEVQEGLDRRFSWWIEIPGYSYDELYKIFVQMLEDRDLEVNEPEEVLEYFRIEEKKFTNYAGDCLLLAKKLKKISNNARFDSLIRDDMTWDEGDSHKLKRSGSMTLPIKISKCPITLKMIKDAVELVKAHDEKLKVNIEGQHNYMYI